MNYLVLIFISLFLTNCNFSGSGNSGQQNTTIDETTPITPKPPALPVAPTPNPPEATPVRGEVCYLSLQSCAQRAESAVVKKAHPKSYNYRDPSSHPSEDFRRQYQIPIAFIDLKSVQSTTPIAPNFIFGEFALASKGRYAILQRHLIETMQKLREKLGRGLKINSGYRSPAYNSSIDGASRWSRHTYGDAVDIEATSKNIKQLQELCTDMGASFTQLYSTHVHCDWRNQPLDNAFFAHAAHHPHILPDGPTISIKPEIQIFQANDNFVTLEVTDFEAEDGKDILYDWQVKAPSGEEFNFNTAKIILPRTNDLYKIEVTIGGTTKVKKILKLNQ